MKTSGQENSPEILQENFQKEIMQKEIFHEKVFQEEIFQHDMKVNINEGPALSLMEKCLDLAAINSKHIRNGTELRLLDQGPARRVIVDDITVLVITFQ